MSRMQTCGNECLDYENDYESILVIKNVPPTTRASKAQQLSLQFYSRPVQQKKSESFLIRKSPYGQLFKTSPIQQKIQLSQKVTPLIKQSPAMIKIKQMVQLQKINQISSFKKLVF